MLRITQERDKETMKEWIETLDGRIVEVEKVHNNFIYGREIDNLGFKLKYGKEVCLAPDQVASDDGTEDDLSIVFKNMDAEINNFFENVNEMFAQERDFYGRCD